MKKKGVGSTVLKWVLLFYVTAAIVVIVVFGLSGGSSLNARAVSDRDSVDEMDEGLRAMEPETSDGSVMSEAEYEAFMASYGKQSDTYETEQRPSKDFDINEHRQILEESREAIEDTREAMETLSQNSAYRDALSVQNTGEPEAKPEEKPEDGDSVSMDSMAEAAGTEVFGVTEAKPEDTPEEKPEEKPDEKPDSSSSIKAESSSSAKNESSSDALKGSSSARKADPDRKYYSFRVQGIGALSLHKTLTQKGDDLGTLKSGNTGYVLQGPRASSGNDRMLVVCNGMVGYASATYLAMTEIEPEDFPEEYLELTEADIGIIRDDKNGSGSDR